MFLCHSLILAEGRGVCCENTKSGHEEQVRGLLREGSILFKKASKPRQHNTTPSRRTRGLCQLLKFPYYDIH